MTLDPDWWADPDLRREVMADLPPPLQAFYDAHAIPRRALRPGYTVFIQAGDRYLYVAPAINPRREHDQVQAMCPLPTALRYVIPGGGQVTIAVHQALWQAHLHGNWFHINAGVRAWLRLIGYEAGLEPVEADFEPESPPPGRLRWPTLESLPGNRPGQVALSFADVAAWLGVSHEAMWYLIRAGVVPAAPIQGGKVVIPLDALRQRVKPGRSLWS